MNTEAESKLCQPEEMANFRKALFDYQFRRKIGTIPFDV